MPKKSDYVAVGAIEIPPAGKRWEEGDDVSHAALVAAGQTEKNIAALLKEGSLKKKED